MKNESMFIRHFYNISASLNKMINFVHFPTYMHNYHIEQLAYSVGQGMGLPERDLQLVTVGALTHDLYGKIPLIPLLIEVDGQAIDRSSSQYKRIQKHIEYGRDFFKHLIDILPEYEESLSVLKDIAYYHHVSYDGKSGYPPDMKQSDIPNYLVPIVQICDCVSAMMQAGFGRIYKKPKTTIDIILDLESSKGTMFNPAITDVTIKILRNELWASLYD